MHYFGFYVIFNEVAVMPLDAFHNGTVRLDGEFSWCVPTFVGLVTPLRNHMISRLRPLVSLQ